MRILIDTNVLISAILNPKGTPFQAYLRAVSFPNHALICDQNIEELRRIFNKKFPKRIDALNRFLSIALLSIEIVQIPTDETDSESLIRDTADRAILRAAINANADILLTGDKDFLESGIAHPQILTPAQFLE